MVYWLKNIGDGLKMMDVGILAVLLLAIALTGILWIMDLRNMRVEEIRIQKLRNGRMYAILYPLLKRLRKRYVEQVRLTRQGIYISLVAAPESPFSFEYEANGFYPLTQAQLHALCQLVETDLDVLHNRDRYRFSRQIQVLPNGQREAIYLYTIKSGYKAAICRPPYYAS